MKTDAAAKPAAQVPARIAERRALFVGAAAHMVHWAAFVAAMDGALTERLLTGTVEYCAAAFFLLPVFAVVSFLAGCLETDLQAVGRRYWGALQPAVELAAALQVLLWVYGRSDCVLGALMRFVWDL